jgi:hypothetical protein
MTIRRILSCVVAASCAFGSEDAAYKGVPFRDGVYAGGAQNIPGRVQCAYFDLGGEGVAYHTPERRNHGSGELNPANGTYLNEFRMNEAVGISYTKFHDAIDNGPFDLVRPSENQLYVGWTSAGEWFNLTVNVAQTGRYAVDLLYTSNRGGDISLDLDGRPLTPPIAVVSTRNAAETLPWRQWHHWNLMREMAVVNLSRGIRVLTFHVLTQGNMNLAYLDFALKD